MKLLVVSTEVHEVNESLCLEQMFRSGLERFHLRKPHWTREEIGEFLLRIPEEFHGRIVLHDHYTLLNEFSLCGAHYNQRNSEDWHVVSAQVHRSISCHSIKELHDLKEGDYQYAFFSPIFPSLSKEGYVPIYSLNEIEQAVKASSVPVIALGGITPSTLDNCARMGFYGAAVLGGVWNTGDPYDAFQQLCKACQQTALPY